MKWIIAGIFWGVTAVSFASADWNPEKIIPQVVLVNSTASPAEQQLAAQMRQILVAELEYWKKMGLPEPTPLNVVINISTYQGLQLVQLLELTNPDIKDVRAHIETQYKNLQSSSFALLLKKFPMILQQQGVTADHVLRSIFNSYAMLRYGFTTSNFIEDVRNNRDLGQLAEMDPLIPLDNAFYQQSLKVEIIDILPKPTPEELATGRVRSLRALFKFQAPAGALKSTSSNLVLLPRSTQGPNDLHLSILNDPSVAGHELAHHINGRIAVLLNEALADYMAASAQNNPLIGEFFAKSSAEVAQRLKNSKTPENLELAQKFLEIAQKGYLRDMREQVTILDLDRNDVFDDHHAGDPLRTVLWNLREDKTIAREQLELSVIKTTIDINNAALLSPRTQAYLMYRKVQLWSAKLTQLDTDDQFEKYEQETKSMRKILSRVGLDTRPATAADYILPEYFRAFYAQAYAINQDLAEKARAQMEKVMVSKSAVRMSPSGKPVLYFIRTDLDKINFIAKWRIDLIVRNLEDPNLPVARRNYLKESLQEYERTGSTLSLFLPYLGFEFFKKTDLASGTCANILSPIH